MSIKKFEDFISKNKNNWEFIGSYFNDEKDKKNFIDLIINQINFFFDNNQNEGEKKNLLQALISLRIILRETKGVNQTQLIDNVNFFEKIIYLVNFKMDRKEEKEIEIEALKCKKKKN
jgi:hypothetical protein